MKGCYVHFLDKDTERLVRSRMDLGQASAAMLKVAEESGTYDAGEEQ